MTTISNSPGYKVVRPKPDQPDRLLRPCCWAHTMCGCVSMRMGACPPPSSYAYMHVTALHTPWNRVSILTCASMEYMSIGIASGALEVVGYHATNTTTVFTLSFVPQGPGYDTCTCTCTMMKPYFKGKPHSTILMYP